MSSFADKVAELGIFADYMLAHLTRSDRRMATYLLKIYDIRTTWRLLSLYNTSSLNKFTLGFFYTAVPMQSPLKESDFMAIFSEVYPSIFGYASVTDLLRAAASSSNWCPILLKEAYYKMFSYKPMADSQHKLNIHFSELIYSIRDEYSIAYRFLEKYRSLFFCTEVPITDTIKRCRHSRNGRKTYLVLPRGDQEASNLYNDQASAVCMYYIALAGNAANPILLLHSIVSVYYPELAKALSIIVKNCGANGTLFGAKLCEAQTLTGRGVGDCDLMAEARYRCNKGMCSQSVWACDLDKLRYYVHLVLEDELKDQVVEFEDLDSFWKRRWQWCVNGSHSAVLGHHDSRFRVKIPQVSQVHRRCVAEQIKDEPISTWNGEAYFTGSLKLEHGKLRALFACDTLTYFAFEHLLRPVEAKWHGHRVLLDPGRGGMVNILKRIHMMRESGGCNIMIDFEDFNSQHSLEAQKIVFEELIKLTGYDQELGATIIRSFDHMNCYVGGRRVGHMYGTLCSGHRATTFINSVLNAAYIATVLDTYTSYTSMHVGDDVYMVCKDIESAAVIMQRLHESTLRINPMKQSVGVHAAEFLRMAVGADSAQGYVARSISSAISGNWLTLHKQSPREFLQTMVEHSWTLVNRSADATIATLLVRSVSRVTRIKRKILRRLLLGTTALNNGPVRASNSNYLVCCQVKEDEDPRGTFSASARYDTLSTLPRFASTDYLTYCSTEMERRLLQDLNVSIINTMVSTSYDKTLSSSDNNCDYKGFRYSVATNPIVRACSSAVFLTARNFVDKGSVGVLNRYPIITQLKNYLNRADINNMLVELGYHPRTPEELDKMAWGLQPHTVAVDGFIPYSDVVSYSAYSDYDYIRCGFPIFM